MRLCKLGVGQRYGVEEGGEVQSERQVAKCCIWRKQCLVAR